MYKPLVIYTKNFKTQLRICLLLSKLPREITPTTKCLDFG